MAKSGHFNLSVTSLGGYVTGWVDWAESEINVANNTSKLTVSLRYRNDYSSATYSNASSFYLTVNGKTVNKTNGANLSHGVTVTVLTQTVTVSHQSDGTKSVAISAGGALSGTSGLSASSGSGTAVLTAIARATMPYIATGKAEIGKTTRINLPRADTSYFHRLWWRMKGEGESNWVQIGDKWTTSCDWTPPMSTCNKIPNAVSAYAEVYCATYTSGDKLIGSNTVSVQLRVPANVAPTITDLTVSPVNDNEFADKNGIYAQGVTKARVKTSATGMYGSTVKSTSVNLAGRSYSGNNVLTATLPAGVVNITVTVTDSRGRTAIQSVSINVLPYQYPYIYDVSYERGYHNNSWVAAENGEDIKLTFGLRVSLTDIGNNVDVAVSVDGKQLAKENGVTGRRTIYLDEFGVDNTRLLAITAVDKLSRHSEADITVATVVVPINIDTKRKRLGLGKVGERDNAVDVALDVIHHKGTISPGGKGRIIQVDMPDSGDIGSASSTSDYYKSWLSWVCRNYPGLQYTTFIGLTRPNSIFFTICTIYDTDDIKGGLPRYSGGVSYRAVQGDSVSFGTNDYVYGVS